MQAGSIHLLQSTALQGSTTHQQVPNRGPITRGHVPGIAPSNHHLAEPAVKSPKRIGAAYAWCGSGVC